MALINFDKDMFEVINIDDQPFFYGSKIAKFLEYARPGNALETHVSPENKTRVQSLDPAQRVLVNEIGVYELIFGSQMPLLAKDFRNYVFGTIIPAFRKQLIDNQPVEEVKKIKPIGNQLMIMNEFDLQVKIVSFLRNYCPDVLFRATHGEFQDTPNKRIICNMKGYLSGVPDLYIMETNTIDCGYFIELKSPTQKGIVRPNQQSVMDRLKLRGYKVDVFDDYDDAIFNITAYISKRILKCPTCGKKFKTDEQINTHINLKHLELI